MPDALHAASDPTTPPEVLAELAQRDDEAVVRAVAGNPNATVEDLLLLAARYPQEVEGNPAFMLGLATDPEALERAYQRNPEPVVALARVASGILRDQLINGDLERAQVALAYRDDLNPDELARLARHNHSLLAVVVANPQAPREALEAAAGAPDPTIRERAASHPRADVDLLQRLARDPHPWVAAAVASNPNTPTQLLWEFAQRPEKAVKRAVLARPDCPPLMRSSLEAS